MTGPGEPSAESSDRRRIVLPARLEQLDGARRWLTELLGSLALPSQQVFEIALAVTEALTNVVRHAYGGPSDQEIVLEIAWSSDRLVITVQDFGRKFDPSAHNVPDLSEPHESGYGIFLMRRFMDEVIYDSTPPVGMILRMVKRRGQAGKNSQ